MDFFEENFKLKPCPFCGGKASYKISYQFMYVMAVCEECGAQSKAVEIYPCNPHRDRTEKDTLLPLMGTISTVQEIWNERAREEDAE